MHFFFRKRKSKQQPQPTEPHNCETALMPVPSTTIIPAIETVKTLSTVLSQHCAFCGFVGATHPFGVGDFYLGKLKYPRLCDACYADRTRKEALHHFAQRKTSVEIPVTVIRKRALLEVERL